MIVDDLHAIETRVREYRQLRDHVDEVKRFKRAGDHIAGHVGRLRPLVRVFQTLRAAGIVQALTGDAARAVSQKAADLAQAFRDRPTAVLDERPFTPSALNEPVATLATALEGQLRRAWVEYVSARVPPANADVLEVLAPTFRSEVTRIRHLYFQLDAVRQVPPETQAAIDDFTAKVAELQQAWQTLDGGQVPPSVLAFLKAASSTGAALALLTDEVRRWLTDHGIDRSFTIRPAR